jgi:hypothetical protein
MSFQCDVTEVGSTAQHGARHLTGHCGQALPKGRHNAGGQGMVWPKTPSAFPASRSTVLWRIAASLREVDYGGPAASRWNNSAKARTCDGNWQHFMRDIGAPPGCCIHECLRNRTGLFFGLVRSEMTALSRIAEAYRCAPRLVNSFPKKGHQNGVFRLPSQLFGVAEKCIFHPQTLELIGISTLDSSVRESTALFKRLSPAFSCGAASVPRENLRVQLPSSVAGA